MRLWGIGIFEVLTFCELLVADYTVLCVLSALGKHRGTEIQGFVGVRVHARDAMADL